MKVLVLGIDALDCELLMKFADELPNITQLRNKAKQLKVLSTFPPDSDTAWATIATGLNPAQHGIVRFVDVTQFGMLQVLWLCAAPMSLMCRQDLKKY